MRPHAGRRDLWGQVTAGDDPGLAAINTAYAELAACAGGLHFAGNTLDLEVLHLVRPPPDTGPDEHLHPVLEVTCVAAGAFTWTSGRTRVEIGPGDILLMPPYRRHRWTSGPARGELLGLMLEVRGELAGCRLERAVQALGCRLQAEDPLGGLLTRVRAEVETGADGDRVLAGHCLRTAMVLVIDAIRRAAPEERVLPGSNAARVVARARDFMLANLSEHLGVAEVAAGIGIGPRHLARCFREAAGTAPGEFLRGLRMDLARHQLLREGRSVREVARSCGFRNDSHFCRVFRRHVGLSPGEWRRRGDVAFDGDLGESIVQP